MATMVDRSARSMYVVGVACAGGVEVLGRVGVLGVKFKTRGVA